MFYSRKSRNSNIVKYFKHIIYMYVLLLKYDVILYPVSNIFVGHSIAFYLFSLWLIQIISGFILLGILSYNLNIQYFELILICNNSYYIWILKLIHMISANIIIIILISHFIKAFIISKILNNNKSIIWLSGSILFLLSLGTAFSGYVIVSGNMSFWAALIILNLATVIPILGDEIVSWLLSDSTVNVWSIKRFTILHFILGVFSF